MDVNNFSSFKGVTQYTTTNAGLITVSNPYAAVATVSLIGLKAGDLLISYFNGILTNVVGGPPNNLATIWQKAAGTATVFWGANALLQFPNIVQLVNATSVKQMQHMVMGTVTVGGTYDLALMQQMDAGTMDYAIDRLTTRTVHFKLS